MTDYSIHKLRNNRLPQHLKHFFHGGETVSAKRGSQLVLGSWNDDSVEDRAASIAILGTLSGKRTALFVEQSPSSLRVLAKNCLELADHLDGLGDGA